MGQLDVRGLGLNRFEMNVLMMSTTVLVIAALICYRVFRFKYDDGIYSLNAFYRQEEDSRPEI